MGFRKTREAKVIHVGWLPRHRYEDRDGTMTCTGIDHLVQVVSEITDGPDAGREVRVILTRAEAMEHIRRLSDAVQKTRDKEQEDL